MGRGDERLESPSGMNGLKAQASIQSIAHICLGETAAKPAGKFSGKVPVHHSLAHSLIHSPAPSTHQPIDDAEGHLGACECGEPLDCLRLAVIESEHGLVRVDDRAQLLRQRERGGDGRGTERGMRAGRKREG